MSTNNTLTANDMSSVLSVDFLASAGISLKADSKAIKAARRSLESNGAYLVKDAKADIAYVVAADAYTSAVTADKFKKRAAIEFAALDMSGIAKTLTAADGKAYTSTHAFFKDVFPTLADSTISNLLGIGRDMYVPALTGTFSDNNELNDAISELSPSNALIVKGALKDEKTRDNVKNALIKSKGNLSANEARQIVSNAKKAAGTDKASKDADKRKTATTSVDADSDTLCATLKKYVVASIMDDELDIHVNESDVKTFKQFLKDNSNDGAKALIAMKALYKLVAMAK